MKLIVVGCGRVGAELAYRLQKKGHQVTVVDNVPSAFQNLNPKFFGRTVEGEALNQAVLERAGIQHAQGMAVVTNSDPLNAVVAHIAHTVYGITNLVVRNYDPRYRAMMEAFDLQIIGSSSWGAQRIEELLYYSEMHTVFSAGNGEIEIYEFSVPGQFDGHPLGDLLPNENCSPVSLTRAGKASLPDCDTIVKESDIVLVSATLEGIEALRRRINQGKEKS